MIILDVCLLESVLYSRKEFQKRNYNNDLIIAVKIKFYR